MPFTELLLPCFLMGISIARGLFNSPLPLHIHKDMPYPNIYLSPMIPDFHHEKRQRVLVKRIEYNRHFAEITSILDGLPACLGGFGWIV
jgi:hypothetical protein